MHAKIEPPILFDEKKQCCGCGACLNICPKQAIGMKEDEHGFLYPYINAELCIGCNRCKDVCAFQKIKVSNYPLAAYAAVSKNKRASMDSASGGIFAAMAHKTLNESGVVFGAAFTENWNVQHIMIDDLEHLRKLQGSKYTQSNIEKTYIEAKNALLAQKNVLYSGTPCQIAGLYGFLGKDYENLLTVDIVCHGVPNNKMFREYISSLESREKGTVTDFKFRDKSIGWGINGTAVINNGGKTKTKIIWQSKEPFLYYFSKGWIYRDSCYSCKYACSHRPADITIGDYWGIEKAHPEYLKKNGWDESKGISLMVINTDKGKRYINTVSEYIELKKSTFEDISAGNAQLVRPSLPGKRDELLRDYLQGGWQALESRYNKVPVWKKYTSIAKSLIPKKLKRKLKQL